MSLAIGGCLRVFSVVRAGPAPASGGGRREVGREKGREGERERGGEGGRTGGEGGREEGREDRRVMCINELMIVLFCFCFFQW